MRCESLTHDPARQFASPYAYGPWDPINGTDPTGAVFGFDDLVIAILVGALVGAIASAIQAAMQGATPIDSVKAAAVGAGSGPLALGSVPRWYLLSSTRLSSPTSPMLFLREEWMHEVRS